MYTENNVVLINKDIYSLEITGAYYYSGGWHIKGVYSLILGFIFSSATIWNSNLMFLYSFSWIIGAFVVIDFPTNKFSLVSNEVVRSNFGAS